MAVCDFYLQCHNRTRWLDFIATFLSAGTASMTYCEMTYRCTLVNDRPSIYLNNQLILQYIPMTSHWKIMDRCWNSESFVFSRFARLMLSCFDLFLEESPGRIGYKVVHYYHPLERAYARSHDDEIGFTIMDSTLWRIDNYEWHRIIVGHWSRALDWFKSKTINNNYALSKAQKILGVRNGRRRTNTTSTDKQECKLGKIARVLEL